MPPVVWFLLLFICLLFLVIEFYALWLRDWPIVLFLRALGYSLDGGLIYLSHLTSEQYGKRHSRTRKLHESLCWLFWQEVAFFSLSLFLLIHTRLYCTLALFISLMAALGTTTLLLYEPAQHVIV